METTNIRVITPDIPYTSQYSNSTIKSNLFKFQFADDVNKRIIIEFKPIHDKYIFYGEAKPKSEWVVFTVLEVDVINDESFVEACEYITNDIPSKIEKLKIIVNLYEHFKDDGIKLTEIEENE